jgi:cyclohexa-1,5-dienecarbonyl-CoA hydratase
MVEVHQEDGIARVVLNAPPLNLLSRGVMAELRESLNLLAHRPELRVLLLEARGPNFSAGASVQEHLAPDYKTVVPEFGVTALAVHEFPLPVVAAVQGSCLGGGFELVQAADVVVAGEGAHFGQPEIGLGVFPPVACALLAEKCGQAVAARLMYTGDSLVAADALAVGLVCDVVPDHALAGAAYAIAERIAAHSASTLRLLKKAMRSVRRGQAGMAIATATHTYVTELMQTRDASEGLHAFLEKRPPFWQHR